MSDALHHDSQPGYGESRTWNVDKHHVAAPLGNVGSPTTAITPQHGIDDANNGGISMVLPAETDASVIGRTSSTAPPAKSSHLDWNSSKSRIQEIYLVQDKTLEETKQIMADAYGFEASEKLFKEKFKLWGWKKTLTSDNAFVMVRKPRQRKLQAGMDTVSRDTTRGLNSPHGNGNVLTSMGIQDETPVAIVSTPDTDLVYDDEMQWSDTETEDSLSQASDDEAIMLTWKGLTAPDFLAMSRFAATCVKDGKVQEAESHYRRALEGLRKISGPTSEASKKVSYSLTTYYIESARFTEALATVEKLIQDYVKVLGFHAKKTHQLVLEVAELLNGWNRQDDAMMLLSRAKDILAANLAPTTRRKRSRGGDTNQSQNDAEDLDNIIEILQSLPSSHDPQPIAHGLNVARIRVTAKDEAALPILRAIIFQCKNRPKELAKENILAHTELLRLYGHVGTAQDSSKAFEEAEATLKQTWEGHDWKKDFATFELMEAPLQLAADALKGGFASQAHKMFSNATDKASEVFGVGDERTVWVSITIGLVYQTHTVWSRAEPWYERAYAAALSNQDWGPDDGIVQSLQTSLDKQHFSYLNDEGRPFKSVFGVTGLVITPTRLHLE